MIERPATHFGNGLSQYTKILNEICLAEGIEITWVSNHWTAILEKAHERHFIMGHKFDLNPGVAELIADDKFATFEVLTHSLVPVAEHALLYSADNTEAYARHYQSDDYLKQYLAQHGTIVLKPNNGARGINVFRVKNFDEAKAALAKIFYQCESASMCPYYEILREYRLIMLDGEERLAYAKERGEDWRFNLQQGARAVEIKDEKLHQKLLQLAKDSVKALDLRFCSVDIIETDDHQLLVLEVNSGVMTEHYLEQHPESDDKIKQIYRDAIRKMFLSES